MAQDGDDKNKKKNNDLKKKSSSKKEKLIEDKVSEKKSSVTLASTGHVHTFSDQTALTEPTGTDDTVDSATTTELAATAPAQGDAVEDEVFDQMLSVLNDLTGHTHIFYDDYTTACNCNCACTCCVRGMVW